MVNLLLIKISIHQYRFNTLSILSHNIPQVKVKEDVAFVTLIAKKPKGHGKPKPDCLTVEMEGPANGQHHEFKHCF